MTWDFVEANVFGPIGLEGPIDSVFNSIHLGIGAWRRGQSRCRQACGLHECRCQYRSAVLRQHRLLRPVGLLLRLAATIAASDPSRTAFDNAGAEGRRTGREPVPSWRQGRERRSSSRRIPRRIRPRPRAAPRPTSRSPSTTRSSSPSLTTTGEASTGWETLLEGMIRVWLGDHIDMADPKRARQPDDGVGTNALASSIVLVAAARPEGAPTTDRRGFIAALEAELPDALRKLAAGQIAPVDLPQAAIGPGMAVFSRYSAVLEPTARR